MRLTETQRHSIKSAVTSVIGEESRVWLFGSRVDDTQRGGDIDLLIETDRVVPSRITALCQIEGARPARAACCQAMAASASLKGVHDMCRKETEAVIQEARASCKE